MHGSLSQPVRSVRRFTSAPQVRRPRTRSGQSTEPPLTGHNDYVGNLYLLVTEPEQAPQWHLGAVVDGIRRENPEAWFGIIGLDSASSILVQPVPVARFDGQAPLSGLRGECPTPARDLDGMLRLLRVPGPVEIISALGPATLNQLRPHVPNMPIARIRSVDGSTLYSRPMTGDSEPTRVHSPAPAAPMGPTSAPRPPASVGSPHRAPVAPVPGQPIAGQPLQDIHHPDPPRRRRPVWPFVLVGIVLLALVGGLVYLFGFQPGDGADRAEPAPRPSATITAPAPSDTPRPTESEEPTEEPSEEPSEEPTSPEEPSPTPSSTSAPTPTPVPRPTQTPVPGRPDPSTSRADFRKNLDAAPNGAKVCPVVHDTAGPDTVARSASGTDVTSCPFAEEVKKAYAAAGDYNDAITVRATSPVTKKNYSMACTGGYVVTCKGGNDAVVVLY